jgi:hypothetical protein
LVTGLSKRTKGDEEDSIIDLGFQKGIFPILKTPNERRCRPAGRARSDRPLCPLVIRRGTTANVKGLLRCWTA